MVDYFVLRELVWCTIEGTPRPFNLVAFAQVFQFPLQSLAWKYDVHRGPAF